MSAERGKEKINRAERLSGLIIGILGGIAIIKKELVAGGVAILTGLWLWHHSRQPASA